MHSPLASLGFVLSLGACATTTDDVILDEVPDDVVAQQSTTQSLGCTDLVPDGVDSVRGLAGSYVRFGAAGSDELVSLNIRTLVEHADSIGVTGDWNGVMKRGTLYGVEHGTYIALPDNPAVGALLGLHSPGHQDDANFYFIVGVRRNAAHKMSALCIVKGVQAPMTATPFLLQRTGLSSL